MTNFYLKAISASLLLALGSTQGFADNPNSVEPPAVIAQEEIATATEEKKEEIQQEVDIAKVSESFGHLIGKNIENLGFKFDIDCVVKGIQDSAEGKAAPLTEMECVQAITAAQEKAFKVQAADNLKKAEAFMAQNAKAENVVSTEENKLQYKVEKKGEGLEIQEHFSPVIRYTGKYLDGTVFGSSKEDEVISLDETIPGLSKALVGMKEGEKRTVYIHPDLGYGTHGYLPPNSLLTFEIECLKANNPKVKEESAISTNAEAPHGNASAEIATPVEPTTTLR